MRESAEEEQEQWLEGKETTFTNALLCARPGSSGWPCFLDCAVVLLPRGEAALIFYLANASTIFS